MASERLRRAYELFRAARQIALDSRRTFLDEACGADAALRAEVESLLAHDAAAAEARFLEPLSEIRRLGELVQPADSSSAAVPLPPTVVDGAPADADQTDTAVPGGAKKATRPAVPDFELIRKLGAGGFGEVWLARSISGVHRAVKLLPRAANPEIELEGLRTYERLARNHAHLIGVRHIGQTPEYFYYVMDLADGYATSPTFSPDDYQPRTLSGDLKRRVRLPLAEAAGVLRQLLAGLEHLHVNGLLHRDIKPDNVVFVNGDAQLGDIGLVAPARAAKFGGRTARYAPPESIVKDAGGDLYCLGRMFYELLAGELPREHGPFQPITEIYGEPLDPFLQQNLAALFERACALEPKRRFAAAAEFRVALDKVSPPPRSAADAAPAAGAAGSVAGPHGQSWPSGVAVPPRRRWPAVAGATLLLILLIAAGVIWYPRTPKSSPPLPPTAVELSLLVQDAEADREPYALVPALLPLRTDQGFKVQAALDRPGHLLAALLTADGKVQLLTPRAASASRPPDAPHAADTSRASSAPPTPDAARRAPTVLLPEEGWQPVDAAGPLLVVVLASARPIADPPAVARRLAKLGPPLRPPPYAILALAKGRVETLLEPGGRVRGGDEEQIKKGLGVLGRVQKEFEGEFDVVAALLVERN